MIPTTWETLALFIGRGIILSGGLYVALVVEVWLIDAIFKKLGVNVTVVDFYLNRKEFMLWKHRGNDRRGLGTVPGALRKKSTQPWHEQVNRDAPTTPKPTVEPSTPWPGFPGPEGVPGDHPYDHLHDMHTEQRERVIKTITKPSPPPPPLPFHELK